MKTCAKVGIGAGVGGIAILSAVLTSKLVFGAPSKAQGPGPGEGIFGARLTFTEHVFNVGRNYKFDLFRDDSPLIGEQVHVVFTMVYPAAQFELQNRTYDMADNHLSFDTGLPALKARFVFTRVSTGETITLMCENGLCARM